MRWARTSELHKNIHIIHFKNWITKRKLNPQIFFQHFMGKKLKSKIFLKNKQMKKFKEKKWMKVNKISFSQILYRLKYNFLWKGSKTMFSSEYLFRPTSKVLRKRLFDFFHQNGIFDNFGKKLNGVEKSWVSKDNFSSLFFYHFLEFSGVLVMVLFCKKKKLFLMQEFEMIFPHQNKINYFSPLELSKSFQDYKESLRYLRK